MLMKNPTIKMMSDREMLMEVLRCVNELVETARHGMPLDYIQKPDISNCDEAYDTKVAWAISSLMEFCERYERLKTTVGKMRDIVNYADRL